MFPFWYSFAGQNCEEQFYLDFPLVFICSYLHRYYSDLRLPAFLLLSSFGCQAYFLFTHYRRKCRFSPVDIYSLYNMNSSNQHRRGMQNLTITINTYVVFHPDHDIDPLVILGFRCSIAIPVILLSTLSLQRYRNKLKTRFKCCG